MGGVKVTDIEELILLYGDIKLSEVMEKLDRKWVCPKCGGKGSLRVRYNAYPSGFPDSGWVVDWKFKNVECEVCEGHGYTKKQLREVVKTEVLGYKEVD